MADETFYYKTGLTGGTSTDLDGIDGADLTDGDAAVVYDSATAYMYLLDDDSVLEFRAKESEEFFGIKKRYRF